MVRSHVHGVVVLTGLLAISSGIASAQEVCLDDRFVAMRTWQTAARGDWLVLATEARVSSHLGVSRREWRFRVIPAGRSGKRLERAELASDGATAVIRYVSTTEATQVSLETDLYVDLTERLLQLPETPREAKQQTARKGMGDRSKDDIGSALLKPRVCSLADPEAAIAGEMGTSLAAHMAHAEYPGASKQTDWKFFAVSPDAALYAPVLQLYAQERVRPSAFDVWEKIDPRLASMTIGQGISKERQHALFREYQILKPPCTVYYTFRSKEASPGSWVMQYWLYYPFDVGGVGPHVHDSEHLFVEIDKLGGAVRRVAGAGHGLWAPNNIYQTFHEGAVPVQLPLFVVVEHGKHATAPDIDRDGWFTPGVDSNNYYDAAKVWGVRDTIGVTDSNMKPYAATMMVRRNRADAYWITSQGDRFIEGAREGLSAEKTCDLVELPEKLEAKKCDAPTRSCAGSQVGSHDDFRDPEKILKPALYPPLALRLAYTRMPTARSDSPTETGRSHRATVGAAFELARVLGGIPGRAAIEAVFDLKSAKDTHFNGIIGRYEWLTSNLAGLYMGASWITDDLGDRTGDTVNRAFWASAGGLFELPVGGIFGPMLERIKLDRRLTAQTSGGLMYNNYYRLNWDFRFGFAVTFLSPNRDFGIKANTPNPY